jgi:hypothetical protein
VRPLAKIEGEIDTIAGTREAAAERLLMLAEEVLEHWIAARGADPTGEQVEGFRLLALHRQGTRGVPSFNACRESCREIAYHYNLLRLEPDAGRDEDRRRMMAMLTKHLFLFVSGKMQIDGLGEFCCASRPLRVETNH